VTIRLAVPGDIPELVRLIEASVRELQAADYTSAQLEGALESVYGVDSQLVADGTYFVVEEAGEVRKELETQLAQVNNFLNTEVANFNKNAAEHGSSTLFAGGPIQIKSGSGAASSASTGNDEEDEDQD